MRLVVLAMTAGCGCPPGSSNPDAGCPLDDCDGVPCGVLTIENRSDDPIVEVWLFDLETCDDERQLLDAPLAPGDDATFRDVTAEQYCGIAALPGDERCAIMVMPTISSSSREVWTVHAFESCPAS